MNLNIVLYQPEIPQNTGNIARTCVLTNSKLHLIKPLGFDISEKQVRRAGLDYWKDLEMEVHESYEAFMEKYGDKRIFLSTTHEGTHYDEISFEEGDFIMFGRESCGVPEEVHKRLNGLRVPMIKSSARSLNLSNTVAIVAYEALRQLGFPNMK
ncbi:tRNA (cytidine(34)-2'-O)-methyltransferase [Clostridium saccharobutylicum]|uniref:Putative tRNA (cytidine(34)-2'-O)-methyltransferase n=2 Tax=Clostridium saccharobutylicum TaxID=169679 RepID=U5MZS2_CLOSA|nr:tRNA (cytidine(34)-2'-O)-methyltransferase [Clostridium saccharobutylicum]AGX45007.1 tRNA (cytidine(34)-2'-O)-methyltransferase TrmL [Clostridium saccharobutylicum DSM 13864]AQR92289.1 tRNA (cytidine(34)-2'-O)-methyltransferase [Clostridium saccharobutylicum]AQS02191.1 tRNA (cytidine(34)-2'-O)-methyltransferase [Clostridium saccharobutylicum]AQS11795.1 tRNA (cytidine(34)-2'-O)-methyltransferase [Clostridium saccharobutylicum]AQS16174.1 tRNA (cytidine(34)-2'-O)-methyltransferase [Clostridium